MTKREVYPGAPLRLVSLELRFPISTRALNRSLWDELELAIGVDLTDVSTFPTEPDSHIPTDQYDPVLRRMSEDRKKAVTLYAGAITIELAHYMAYGDLKGLADKVLDAFERTSSTSLRYTRIGLRYINEIRASSVGIKGKDWNRSKSWVGYINEQLLGEVESPPSGLCAFANRKSAFFHSLAGQEYLSLQYGISAEGMIDPSDVLVLDGTSGPCFILDFDAFQTGTAKAPVASSTEEAMETIDRLHELVESGFQWSVTDQSREVFRGRLDVSSSQQSSTGDTDAQH